MVLTVASRNSIIRQVQVSLIWCFVLVLISSITFVKIDTVQAIATEEIYQVLDRLEDQVVDFSNFVQTLLSSSSSSVSSTGVASDCEWLQTCIQNNYDHCVSKFTNNVQCIDIPFNDTQIQAPCYKLYNQCSTRFDYTVSTIRLASSTDSSSTGTGTMTSSSTGTTGTTSMLLSNTTLYRIFESVCRTRVLDEQYFIPVWTNASSVVSTSTSETTSSSSISNSIVPPRSMYFGSVDGMFRIYPARQSEDDNPTIGICKKFDPRIRPWYSAASSTRRNIILLLDTSSTMTNNRLDNMKEAATRIITASTISDKIAAIQFNDIITTVINNNNTTDPSSISPTFYPANLGNKNMLNTLIKNITSSTNTVSTSNYTSALTTALNLISTGLIDCSTAILLFTDNIQDTKDALVLIQSQFNSYTTQTGNTILVFIYVMSAATLNVHTFDCTSSSFSTGLWSTILEKDEINNGLSTYFEVFQTAFERQRMTGSSSTSSSTTTTTDRQRTEVAWVEPYPFHTFGVMGTTVSSPVYDTYTGQLLGVVGIDNSITDFLQYTRGYNDSEIIRRARNKVDTDSCPNFSNLSPCSFQFHKRLNDNSNVLCSTSTSTAPTTVPVVTGISTTVLNNTTNTTTSNETTSTSTEICPNNVYIVSTTMFSNILDNATIQRQQCCSTNNINCYDITRETSALWNNSNFIRMTYPERGCCRNEIPIDTTITCPDGTTRTTSTSTNTFIDSQLPSDDNDQCVWNVNDTTTIANDPCTTSGSNESSSNQRAITSGIISGVVIVVFAILFFIILWRIRKAKVLEDSEASIDSSISR